MSYSQNKEEINKVVQVNSLNNRGRFFLRTEDYERAKECFLGVLEVDEENMDALINLLLLERGLKSIDQVIDYYRNLFIIDKSEKVEACEYGLDLIEQFKEEYYVENYLSKEEIGELFEYKEEITYDSRLSNRETQRQLIEEEINRNPYLSKLKEMEDPQAREIIKKILEPYDKKLEEAKNADQFARMKIATNYRRFIEKQSEEVRRLAKEAEERKESDYNAAVEAYHRAEEIEDLEGVIEDLKKFEGYKEADEYIKNCKDKIEDIRSRLKAVENQNKVRELLNSAKEGLKNGDFEKADELYFEVISKDAENPEAYLGILLAENEVIDKEDLFNVYFKTDYSKSEVKAIGESNDTIEKYIDKYYLPNYLEKEEIRRLFSYKDFYYDSFLESANERKEELKKEFERNQTISWLMEHEDPFTSDLYRELNEKYDQQIEEFKQKDELEAVNKTIKYQRFLKNTTREVKQKYEDAIKKKEEDYQHVKEVLESSDSIKEVKDAKKILNDLGEYKDSKDLLFEALNKIEELKIIEKEAEFRKELDGYVQEAKELLKEDKFEEADRLFQKVYSFDDENVEARIGLLMVENNCHDINELIESYRKQYSTSQFDNNSELINGKTLIDSHIQNMADKYSVPGRLERSTIINLYNNEEIFYKSTVSKLEGLLETLEDDIAIDENLSWICERENNELAAFFKELKKKIEKAIRNARKEDVANQKKIREEYKSYAKQIDEAVIDLYIRIKRPEEEAEEAVEAKEEPTSLDELASLHNLNLEVEHLEIPKLKKEEEIKEVKVEEVEEEKQEEVPVEDRKFKFNVSGLFNKLKENKQQEEERKLAEEQERIRTEEALRARFILEMEQEEKARRKNEETVKEPEPKIEIPEEKPVIEEPQRVEPEPVIEKPKKQEEELEHTTSMPFVIQRPKPIPTITKSEPEKEQVQAPAQIKEEVKKEEAPVTEKETRKQRKERKKKEKAQNEPGSSRIIFVMLAVILVLSGIIGNIVYRTVIRPNNLYNEALELIETQQYNRAIEIFEELGDYKDSAQLINETYYKKAMSLYEQDNAAGALDVLKNLNSEESKNKIKEIKSEIINKAGIGDTIIFGEYEQDGDKDNGREYIEWEVLDIEENRLLIISKYCLDVQKYNDTSEESDWKSSSIRSWLNGRFAANAFDSEDPAKVVITNLYSISNSDEEDQITNDRIFLLGSEDVEKYYPQKEDRMCQASENLINSNLYIDGNGNCSWWLRDGITEDSYSALIIDSSGEIMESMYELSNAIRPVMWITK